MNGRGLLVFFAMTLLLPGAALGVFGARALIQERQLVDQQMRERLEDTAESVARDLDRQLQEWDAALEGITKTAQSESRGLLLPPILRPAANQPGAGAVVMLSAGHKSVWPRESVLYDVTTSASESPEPHRPRSPALIQAETLEFARSDYAGAIQRYQRLASHAGADERADMLHRLARTYRKSGKRQQALALFEKLKTTGGLVGAVPAALVGHYEVCAHHAAAGDSAALGTCGVDFYSRLVAGQWRLSKERYSYYSSTARDWAAAGAVPASKLAALADEEHAKARLTAAVDAIPLDECAQAAPSASGAEPDVVMVRRCTPNGPAGAGSVLVLSHGWLASQVWPGLTAAASDAYHVAVADRADRTLYSSQAERGSSGQTSYAVTRDVMPGAQGWRVRVWPRDTGTFAAGFVVRQRLYLLTLALVIASLVFGAYATHRVVTRELQVARLKSDFVATVSHEFRSPLTAIRQLGEMLMRDRVPEARRPEYYERITRESERLGRLVEHLLDFAQMEEGRKRYELRRLDTADWLRRTVADFQALREGQPTAVTATIPAALPPVQADPAALASAVHNLLDNAIKYSPGTDTVWLEAESDGGGVTIRVRDRGVGISDRDRPQIFEKFFRADGDITREVKGAGLGLSLVQHVVAAHNGRIECESLPGHGTTFSIHLGPDAAEA